MKKILFIGLGAILFAYKLSGKDNVQVVNQNRKPSGSASLSNRVVPPTRSGKRRGCDPLGCGHFGASRGSRKHKGVDYSTNFGEEILSPISGYIERYPDPYGDGQYSGVQIKGTGVHQGYLVKMFYLSPSVPVRGKVVAGQKVGNAQNISRRHGASMINHVHVEIYRNGQSVDFEGAAVGSAVDEAINNYQRIFPLWEPGKGY